MPDRASDERTLFTLLTSYWASQAVYTVAKLGIADALAHGPRSCAEIARTVGADERALFRLLRALVALGVCARTPDQRFELAPMAELLRADHPRSLHHAALLYGERCYRAWGDLARNVETGENAHTQRFGAQRFQSLNADTDEGEVFDRAMAELSRTLYDDHAIVDAYDFSQSSTLVDVGGGRGALAAAVAERHPGPRIVVFDQPRLYTATTDFLAERGLHGRVHVVSGDFFESVPEGGDLYVLKRVLHDWDDERAHTILRHCHRAARPGAHLLVVEMLVPEDDASGVLSKLYDLHMMIGPGGLERTASEYQALLHDTGFTLARILATDTDLHVLEAERMP